MQAKSILWYQQPAVQWEEALPIGNGRLGAMVFGGIDAETLQLNEESMWYGGKVDRINPDFKDNLPLIRRYLEEGKISAAENLMDSAMSGCPDSMHPYQTLGDIQFWFGGIRRELVTEYRRYLDLTRGVTATEFRCEDTSYRREIFASHPSDVIAMHFLAQGPGCISFRCKMRRGKFFDGVKRADDHSIELYGNLGRGGYEFSTLLSAKVKGEGFVQTVGECLEVQKAKEVVLYFTADTTYHVAGKELDEQITDYKPKAETELCSAEQHYLALAEDSTLSGFERKEYWQQAAVQSLLHMRNKARIDKAFGTEFETVKTEHEQDYKALFDRFEFNLECEEDYGAVPTDERLKQAADGNADIGLSKLLMDFGRYLTISCSRREGLPATLQGLWNKDFLPPWDSKYTININTEMNYWHVESTGLSECHLPLFTLLDKVRENGRQVARRMYGCRGFVAHHNTDIHGDAAPQDVWYPGTYWTMGGAWLSTHLWTHYLYTKDKAFLEKAFPVMAEAALFFVDFLMEKDGYLVTNPSVSPENTYRLPNGESGSCCIGATMDNQILRHLFTACLGAFRELDGKVPENCTIEGVEDITKLMEEISHCMEKLMPTRISDSGRIMEWPEDYEEVEPGHRHISHLYGLYPAGEITMDGTPELACAARKTLEYRLSHGGGHTGWSRAWIMNHYASLWDGETAYENITKMLGQSTYPNMFDKHPPFQIDGNFGAAAAISCMLAQCNEDRVVLLPALPKAWHTGSVRGLRLIGDAELSMSWKDGCLTEATIYAHHDYETDVFYQQNKVHVMVQRDGSVVLGRF